MSMTQTLAPHLPYLRRYARALTGSQQSGDTHVRAALTALLEGDESLTEGVAPRVALYQLFHAIWQSGAEHYDDSALEGAKSPENRLRTLSASKRAALLLTAVEAFSPEEAAFIIDESPEEIEKAINYTVSKAEVEGEMEEEGDKE
jgi:DNA-directed RNA polymerase specialized sigma24 family protein